MEQALSLVSVALEAIEVLSDDAAKERTLGALLRAMNEIDPPSEDLEPAFERALELAGKLSERYDRVRALTEVASAVAVSRLARDKRATLLERAAERAFEAEEPSLRVDLANAVIKALIDLRYGDSLAEIVQRMVGEAKRIDDDRLRVRGVLLGAQALARSGADDEAMALLETVAPSAARARSLAAVASALHRGGRDADARGLVDRALLEIGAAEESFERAHALRSVLAFLVESGIDPDCTLVDRALERVGSLAEVRFKKDALLGAIRSLAPSELEPEEIESLLGRVEASVEAIVEVDVRADLLAALAVSLAEVGEVDGAERALRKILDLSNGFVAVDLVDPVGQLPSALPVVEILSALVESGTSHYRLQVFAESALAMVGGLRDAEAIRVLLERMTRFFISPAFSYGMRVHLLHRALSVAQHVADADARVAAAVDVANALSMAGATERGDALFEGVVAAIGAPSARRARCERAITLVRLGRTAEAREQLLAAAYTVAQDQWHAIEELAIATARAGFLGDMLEHLARVHPSREAKARAQIADALAESTYLDPYLREIGLSQLAEGAQDPAARHTIQCLLAEVRMLEGLADTKDVFGGALERARAVPDKTASAVLEQELVAALIERLERVAR